MTAFQKLKIACILPVYNVGKYLEETLVCLEEQIYKEFKVFAVNDGSRDNSLELLKKHAKIFPNLIIIDQSNQGLPGARNSALDAIETSQEKFDLIAFIDSDDLYAKNYFEEMVAPFENEEVDFVSAGWCNFDLRGKEKTGTFPPEKFSFSSSDKDLVDHIFQLNKWSGHPAVCKALNNKIFRAEIIKGSRFDVSLKSCEDQDWLIPQLKKFRICATVNSILYFKRRRSSSISHLNANWQTELKTFKKLYELPSLQGGYVQTCLKNKLIEGVWNEFSHELEKSEKTPLLKESYNIVRNFDSEGLTNKQRKRLSILKLGKTITAVYFRLMPKKKHNPKDSFK
ncbi:glycosyltransferase family 2 protein [Parasutterella excrementihominis]|uniref:glycosyltransferase family 2 protein n=1 Tax=Parasutterella excrementihominis TaxID=487175 RepID=UPI003A90521F